MKSKRPFQPRVSSFLVAIPTVAVLLFLQANAATWDVTPGTAGAGDSLVTGGTGIWNATNGNWTNNAGAANISWNNAANDAAIFGGASGVVSLATGINAGSVTFTSTGYSITGNMLTLGGAAPVITVGSGLFASISSDMAGSDVNFGTAATGLGTLALSGTNTHSGLTYVNFGAVNIRNSSALGTTDAGTVVANGAALGFQDGVQVLNEGLSARGAGIGNTGALRNLSGDNRWTGTLTLTNSIVIASDSGSLTLGAITGGSRHIIFNGAGNLTVDGEISGTGSSSGSILMQGSSTGTMALKGADTFTGAVSVTSGTLSLEGPRTATSGSITVGNGQAQAASLNFTNGNFSTGAANIVVGSSPAVAAAPAGTGIVNHSAGTLSTGGLFLLGNAGAGNPDNSGTGTYNLSGGKFSSSSDNLAAVCLGTNHGGTATFNLSGTGIFEMTGTGLLQIGRSSSDANSSTGTFSQTGGAATLANMAMGNTNNSNTTSALNLTGGTFVVASGFTAMAAGADSTAAITIGGSADVTLPAFPTLRGSGSTATLTFDGGILKPAASSTAYLEGLTSAAIKAGGATISVSDEKKITVSQGLLADAVSTGGGLTKLGGGALTLAGNCTYTGDTTVTSGTLAVDGSLAASSAVTVDATATLAGSGTIGGTVSSSGTIAPGNDGIGTLTTGAVTLTGGNLAIQVGGAAADKLISTGAVYLTNTTLSVTEITPGAAYSHIIAEGTGINGTFASASLPEGYSVEYTPNRVVLNHLVDIDDYVTWAGANGLSESNRDLYQDPDNDSVNNLMEYILAGLPIGSGAVEPSILPNPSIQENHLIFSYRRSVASMNDTTQIVQTSTDLINWTDFATIGPASAGPVTIVMGSGNTDTVNVAIPRSYGAAGKLFARLYADPDVPYLGPPPGMMELLQHWAPVIHQEMRTDTDSFIFMTSRQLYGARDCIVAINFDGEWDVANNWHNSRYQPNEQGTLADRLTPPLQAKAYAAVVESGLYCFLNYGFYHNGQDSVFSEARHQNDWEQVVLVIRKDDTKFGGLAAMMTQFHTDQNIYQPQNITCSGHRPVIYIEPNGGTKGHGIQAYANQNPGNRGVVYRPGPGSQNVTSVVIPGSGNWATAPVYEYKLIPIGEMWGLMNKTGLYDPYAGWKLFNYARTQNYPDYEQAPSGGNPPWDRTFFMNPLVFFAETIPGMAADSYLFNPYLNGSSTQAGPANPNGVVPASDWIKTQLGGTSGLAWTLRNETILYHRSGTGTGDRVSFHHRQTTGNFSIQGRVHSVQDIGNSRAGLMIRNSLSATSKMIALWVGPDQRVHLQYRSLDGGSVASGVSGEIPQSDQPVTLRLQRAGDQIIAGYTHTGDFTVLEAVHLPMSEDLFAGMAASSNQTNYFSASTITDLEVTTTP